LFYGFCALGVLTLYLWFAFKISKTWPTLGRFLSALALAGFYAVLLSVISVWFVGSRTAVYLVPISYPLALFVAWKELKPEAKDELSLGGKPESGDPPRP
jgi:hypothetical protein